MSVEDRLKLLKACSLFAGLCEETLIHASEASSERQFPAGTSLFSADERYIGVIAGGSAKAFKHRRGENVAMNVLGYGDVFGAASLMGGELPPTDAVAVRTVTAMILTEDAFLGLMREDFALTENFCRYLIGRVRFLTDRVECMAGTTAADKLLIYLETNADGNSVHLPFGMNSLAKALSFSRASLYRALSELEAAGKISRSGHEIRLLK